jgi:hypothetical protein
LVAKMGHPSEFKWSQIVNRFVQGQGSSCFVSRFIVFCVLYLQGLIGMKVRRHLLWLYVAHGARKNSILSKKAACSNQLTSIGHTCLTNWLFNIDVQVMTKKFRRNKVWIHPMLSLTTFLYILLHSNASMYLHFHHTWHGIDTSNRCYFIDLAVLNLSAVLNSSCCTVLMQIHLCLY